MVDYQHDERYLIVGTTSTYPNVTMANVRTTQTTMNTIAASTIHAIADMTHPALFMCHPSKVPDGDRQVVHDARADHIVVMVHHPGEHVVPSIDDG